MTISTTSNQTVALGNGVTETFSFSFIYDSSSFITVIYVDATGVMTVLAPSLYTLFLNPPAANSIWGVGGTVTYPLSGSPIANGTSLIILRTLPLLQLTSISNQGPFAPEVIEAALDTGTMQVQQVSSRTGQLRGTWISDYDYNYGDVVQDGVNGLNTQNYYMCAIANASTTWSTDLAAGDWSLAINVQQIAADASTASAAATSATASAAAAATSQSATAASAGTATAAAGTAVSAAAAASANAASTAADKVATDADVVLTHADVVLTHADVVIANAASATSTTQAGIATTQATNAAASAVLAASTLTATSTTSNSIGTGAKTYTIQTNKQFQGGQYITANNGVNSNAGTVTSYDPATGILVMSVSKADGSGTFTSWNISISGQPGANGSGSGTVTSVAVTTANGVSASVSNPTSTPTLSFALGAITPTTVVASGNLSGANLSGANTGDQTITLTGDVTGSGTGSFAATIGASKVTTSTINALAVTAAKMGSGAATNHQVATADGAGAVTYANQLLTSVAGRTGAVTLSNSDISGLGTAATLNVGTGANNIVQLNGSSQLPAVSGALLTNLPSTGGCVFLGSQTASNSTALNFTSVITSSYDEYMFVFKDFKCATNASSLLMQVSTNNGVSYIAGTTYTYTDNTLSSSSLTWSANTYGASGLSSFQLGFGLTNTLYVNGTLWLNNPLSTTSGKTINGDIWQDLGSGGSPVFNAIYGFNTTAAAVNAVRFLMSSGNITSGSIEIYGFKNS